MEYLDAQESTRRAQEQIQGICEEYGLYGNVVYHTPSSIADSDRNRFYIVAGTDPALAGNSVPKAIDPEDVIRKQERNSKLFYPNVWAYDLTENSNQMKAQEELVDHLKKTEFLSMLYGKYDLPLPEKIRVSEIHQLIDFYDFSTNPKLDQGTRQKAKKDLDWFFKREGKTGFSRRWLDYFRSDRFPDDKGPFAKVLGYFQKNKSRTSMEELMEGCEDVHKLQMQEHEYKLFTRFMSKAYPEVLYAAGEKDIVNHGGVNNAKETQGALGRRVTGEEFAVICKDRFAEEGWDAIENLKPAYWEFRDVYFKACDEPLVAAAYNSITLQYAKCDQLAELIEPYHLVDVPVTDFMNFVSLAKANNLHFHIDNAGKFAIPSLENVHVIYSEYQQEKLGSILNRMMDDKVEFSHVLDSDSSHPKLSQVIEDMDRLRLQHKPEHIISKAERSRNK